MTRSILAPDYAEIVSQVLNLTCICTATQGPGDGVVGGVGGGGHSSVVHIQEASLK